MSQAQDEVKRALEEMKKGFEEFKQVNDKRLESLKAEKALGDFDQKLANINEALNKQEEMQRKWMSEQEAERKKQEEQERRLEAHINRAVLGLGPQEEDKTGEKLYRSTYENWLRHGEQKLNDAERKLLGERKVMTVGADTTGGYLAPPEFVKEIIKAEVLFSPMRSLVTVRQSSTGELELPKRTSTAAATRVGESSTRVESTNPAYGLMKIRTPEMYAEARVTNANLEDSAFDLEQLLTDEFSEQFGVLEGSEVISGNGVEKILGILDANAAGVGVAIANTVSGSAALIAGPSGAEGDGLVNLFHAVKTAYAARGAWILNRASLGKVRLLKDTTGRYLWQPGVGTLAGGGPAGAYAALQPTILGSPYIEAPDMPNEGANAYPIAFGDWKRAFVLVDRIDMQITRDPYTVASSGQVKFHARRRVGGQTVLGEAIRLLKCSA